MRKTKLTISSGRGNDWLRVTVEDEISGMAIVRFDLSPGDFWSFAGGAYLTIDGEITEHFDRVGKAMRTDRVVYTRDDLKSSTYDQQLNDAKAMARADRPGWDTYSAQRRGGGYGGVQVTMRRWEAIS